MYMNPVEFWNLFLETCDKSTGGATTAAEILKSLWDRYVYADSPSFINHTERYLRLIQIPGHGMLHALNLKDPKQFLEYVQDYTIADKKLLIKDTMKYAYDFINTMSSLDRFKNPRMRMMSVKGVMYGNVHGWISWGFEEAFGGIVLEFETINGFNVTRFNGRSRSVPPIVSHFFGSEHFHFIQTLPKQMKQLSKERVLYNIEQQFGLEV